MKHALATLALLFALALPASAQDETETPAPPTPTVEATAVVTDAVPAPTVEPTPAPEAPDSAVVATNIIAAVGAALMIFAAGAAAGGFTFAVYANKLRNDAAFLAAIEGLANSYPTARPVLRQVGEVAGDVGAILVEAGDDIPYSSKQQP